MPGFTDSTIERAEQRTIADGVVVHELYRSGDTPTARRALAVRFAPGARWPGDDVHEPGPEDVFVLDGEFLGLTGPGSHHAAGAFVHCDRGTSHSPSTATGGMLLVYYPEG